MNTTNNWYGKEFTEMSYHRNYYGDFNKSLDDMKRSGEWFCVSIFGTNYGKFGYKFECEAYKYGNNGTEIIDRWSTNIDGKDYKDAKRKFWKNWNIEHPKEELNVMTFKSAWGL